MRAGSCWTSSKASRHPLPDGALTIPRKKQLVRRVEMRGEALKVYDLKRRLGLPGRRLRAYCNVCIFHAAFHDGRAGSKGRVLAYPLASW